MIEQIYTYFTVEMIYMWLNLGVLPFWFVLIVFPQSHISRFFITSIFPILILGLTYIYLLYIAYVDGYDFFQNFRLYLGFSEIFNLFENQYFLILFWAHFLTMNLFCGGWIVKNSQLFNINKFLISLPLITTYLIGPIGIILYWLIRIFYAKKISLYE
ncbi:ABA4-like family protein [Candidatus Pelagibacter sp.]|nr:ABA4-like family protein [Candidatus Pelagibacter sp.]MDB9937002.1 ABA4-like family protein [Candidatus Pelagibacter sp.]|tara:strand:+ start:117 stop:590 length:474 start_codon:yes stop_codon:yes gene_type:complete